MTWTSIDEFTISLTLTEGSQQLHWIVLKFSLKSIISASVSFRFSNFTNPSYPNFLEKSGKSFGIIWVCISIFSI